METNTPNVSLKDLILQDGVRYSHPEISQKSQSRNQSVDNGSHKKVPSRKDQMKAKNNMERPGPHKSKFNRRFCLCNAMSGPHKLIGSCLNCGKIICSEEGEGPCLFCGNDMTKTGDIVPTDVKNALIDHEIEQVDELEYQMKLEEFQKVLDHKNKLLDFEKNTTQRTKVLDDSTDWYSESNNKWLTKEERQFAAHKAAELEKNKKDAQKTSWLTFDFDKGGDDAVVVVDKAPILEDYKSHHEGILPEFTREEEKSALQHVFGTQRMSQNASQNVMSQLNSRVHDTASLNDILTTPFQPNPCLHGDSRLLYDTLRERLTLTSSMTQSEAHFPGRSSKWTDRAAALHLDTKEDEKKDHRKWKNLDADEVDTILMKDLNAPFDENVSEDKKSTKTSAFATPYNDAGDQGLCLSLHQPWASLIVYGFKRIEGRVWQTHHKGRLWIHAASKTPTSSIIEEVELYYADIYDTQSQIVKNHNEQKGLNQPIPMRPPFPSDYPISCLLGCVDLIDCVSQSTYLHFREEQIGGVLATEDNNSPYIFICQNPRKLLLPIQMLGDHKLWKLPISKLPHYQKALRPVLWSFKVSESSNSMMQNYQKETTTLSLIDASRPKGEIKVIKNLCCSIGPLTPLIWKNALSTISRMEFGCFVLLPKFLTLLLQQSIILDSNTWSFQSLSSSIWKYETWDMQHTKIYEYYTLINQVVADQFNRRPEMSIKKAKHLLSYFIDWNKSDQTIIEDLFPLDLNQKSFPLILLCIGLPVHIEFTTKEFNLLSGDVLFIQIDSTQHNSDFLKHVKMSSLASVGAVGTNTTNGLLMKSGTLFLLASA